MNGAARPELGTQVAAIAAAVGVVLLAVLVFVAANATSGVGPFDRAVVSWLALVPAVAVPGLVAMALRPVDHRVRLGLIAVVAAVLGVLVAWPLWTSLASLCAANQLPFSPLNPLIAGVGTAVGVAVALVAAVREPTPRRALLVGALGAVIGGAIVLGAVAVALVPQGECLGRPV